MAHASKGTLLNIHYYYRCGSRAAQSLTEYNNGCCSHWLSRCLQRWDCHCYLVAWNPDRRFFPTNLKDIIESTGLLLEVREVNVFLTLTVNAGLEMHISGRLLSILGLDDGVDGEWLNEGMYNGDHPSMLLLHKNALPVPRAAPYLLKTS